MKDHNDPTRVTRREALGTLGAIGGVALLTLHKGEPAMADDASTPGRPPIYKGEHQLKPLPFDPGKLKGLSDKLLTSHHQNNYGGAVKRLNLIQQQLGTLPKDAPPYQMGSLKREELVANNSMLLHELYFGNLGGNGRADGGVAKDLGTAFGSLASWGHDFRATGLSLAGGSGWVVLSFDPPSHDLHNWWAWDHTHSVVGGIPLLVMDMYEHSYHMDYGANATGYIDAFFQNVNWDEVNRRLERAAAKAAR